MKTQDVLTIISLADKALIIFNELTDREKDLIKRLMKELSEHDRAIIEFAYPSVFKHIRCPL